MTISQFMEKWWSLPSVVLGEFVVIFGGMWLVGNLLPVMPFPAERKNEIRSWTIALEKGAIEVTDIKSGTEFNRILQFPNGRIVVESGYINRWGEDQIRIIGDRSGVP
jgi:hypothetical protein